jgi:hypothetical protein
MQQMAAPAAFTRPKIDIAAMFLTDGGLDRG